VLHAEDVSIARLAAEVGTPFYCYSTATLTRHYRVLSEAFAGQNTLICFAVKSNSNQAVLRTLGRLGAGMDVVSEGELRRALAADVPASKIIFAGVGKSRQEIAFALSQDILGFNVESEPELRVLSEEAVRLGLTARIALRVNPDVDAKTHAKISTGKAENKFGIPFAQAPRLYAVARTLPGIEVSGIHMHIGSQITELEPFRNAFRLLRELAQALIRDGHAIHHLDIGGGLGVPYMSEGEVAPPPSAYAAVAKDTLGDLGLKLILEPGRVIVGNAGVMLTRVLYRKSGEIKNFTIVDAAFNDLLRPAFYGSYHGIKPVTRTGAETWVTDVVGPICETGDFLARDREMKKPAQGEVLAFMSAGAYGFAMSSNYNSRPRAAEVLVKGDRFAVVRRRESLEDLVRGEEIPSW
jgi:diaminopimelate decarboxylase